MTATPLHALSVDVEDWFQVLNLAGHIDRSEWERIELRCGDSTRRLLDLFDRRGARATFFFLGWIAERIPDLVAEVAKAGHEIGSHGYDHKLLTQLGEAGFREDLARTSTILEGLCGARPSAFRACTWSVTTRTPWAPRVLVEQGFTVDSSIYPVAHPDYGVLGAPARPYRLSTSSGSLLEFPPLTWRIAGRMLPVGGGGYLRLFPTWVLERGLRQAERSGFPGCIYLHPWEVDPAQPRVGVGGLRGFRHYVNLEKTLSKLDRLISRHRFGSLTEALSNSPSTRSLPTFEDKALLGSANVVAER
ncbi:MAG: XrtA system polysaccharide deacetylase [Planctomycetota bacterium]